MILNMIKLFHNLGYKLKISNAYKFDKYESLNKISNEDILRIQKKYHSMGGGNPKLQFSKLLEIKKICKKYEISSVLEFGTGSSSVVFEKLKIRVKHIEENHEWWKLVQRMINNKKIDFQICNKITEGNKEYYDLEIKEAFDLIYIDGPSLTSKNSICYDIFRVKDKYLPKIILVDMRLSTVNSIKQELSDKYNLLLSDIFKRDPKQDFQYHSLFEKRI